MIDKYHSFLLNRGKEVRVLQPGDEHEGVAEGIDALGNLLVIRNTGEKEQVFAGEVYNPWTVQLCLKWKGQGYIPYKHAKKDRTKTVCCVIYETSGSRENKETE